ncbi:MAG: hypothetical protein IJW86_05840 [Clostridia bacterium]|nr:hypothetical protein [Clostridia bacterium]
MPDDKYRIIKIGKEALFELICEAFKESEEAFFDVSDATTIVKSFSIDWEKGEFICVARNELPQEEEHLQFDFDTHKLISKIEDTTDTLFAPNRYIEVLKSDIDNL